MYPVITFLGLTVKSYTLFAVIAALTGTLTAYRALVRASFPRLRSALWLLAAGAAFLIGARLWNVAVNPDAYGPQRPWYVLKMTGFSLYGGLAGGALALFLCVKASGMKTGPVLDACAVPFAAAFCISRIGCFLNGCCGGVQTGLPWGISFPSELDGIRTVLFTLKSPRVHPTQLYELLAALAGIPLCLFLAKRFRAGDGGLTALYGAWFCLMRLAILPLRALPYPGIVTKVIYPVVYAVLTVLGIILFIRSVRPARRAGGR